ncbi:MAG: metalloregulator ArsR/SmtB family transcription factor [Lachnospiraceae bacterium]|nr:metalloregulator ArsR/SmtB family transcription factor [Lachnospiraceae bacterium]
MAEKIDICDCDIVHVETVEKVKKAMPEESEVNELSMFFKILGDPTRIRIMWALDQAELCVCDVCATLGMTKSAVSHQLAILRRAKLVKFRRDGKNVYYSLDDQHVNDIIEIAAIHLKHN